MTDFMNEREPETRTVTNKTRGSLIEYRGKQIRETDNAVLFRFQFPDEDDKELWIPYSQISYLKINKMHGTDTIRITEWIAKTKGLPV